MKPQQVLRTALIDTYRQHGWEIPNSVIDYESELFSLYIDKPDFEPKPSYAEQYMTMNTVSEARRLADCCFFTRSVFPDLKQHRGISSSYFVDMGQGCYDRVYKETGYAVMLVMRDHFEFLAECAYTAIRMNGEFRSMWED
jgi:hypothetical protein